MSVKTPICTCAYCGTTIIGAPQASIHRDGFGVGPEVPLCWGCGGYETPTCDEIWDRISQDSEAPREPSLDV